MINAAPVAAVRLKLIKGCPATERGRFCRLVYLHPHTRPAPRRASWVPLRSSPELIQPTDAEGNWCRFCQVFRKSSGLNLLSEAAGELQSSRAVGDKKNVVRESSASVVGLTHIHTLLPFFKVTAVLLHWPLFFFCMLERELLCGWSFLCWTCQALILTR